MFSRKTKNILLYITFGICLYALLMNLGSVLSALSVFFEILVPLLFGLLFAFIMNVPMNFVEGWMQKWWPNFCRKAGQRWMHAISLLLTLAIILLIIFLAARLVIPALVSSAKTIGPLIREKWPDIVQVLNAMGIDTSGLAGWLESINLDSLQGFDHVFSKTYNLISSAVSMAISAIFGFIISIYILMSKERLGQQMQKLLLACLPEKAAHTIFTIYDLLEETYARFLSGQCLEACFLGLMMFASYYIFQLPYAGLTGLLTGLFAFIPYIGAFGSLAISAFLVFLMDPHKVILCVIVYSVTQFIENQFVYPHVVGSSVGLSPLFTLLAALFGGRFFGLLGIIFCIPLAAALYQLLSTWVNERLAARKISTDPGPEIHPDS